ncbi:MAG: transposase [Tannerellaceae bacterium]|nr:transposase [Tannerellaceae bacterium]
MEKYPITARSLERFFHVREDEFERQYKEYLSGYRSWEALPHAKEWLLFPENTGPYLSIDETSLSNGELYTVLTNRERHGKKGCLVAIVSGTKSEDVIAVLEQLGEEKLQEVKEVTLDLSESMRKIVRRCFPQASRVIDRFHVQKLAFEATQEIRIKHRWEAIQEETELKENAKFTGEKYEPERFENGDTRKELLARSRYLLFKSGEKWTQKQRLRAEILFKQYPDIRKAYSLTHSLRLIFNKRSYKDSARLNMAKWYNKVEQAGFHSFNVIAATFYEHSEEILNFYINRSTNAAAESFNAKIKAFRTELRGVLDIPFFLFRLSKLYA